MLSLEALLLYHCRRDVVAQNGESVFHVLIPLVDVVLGTFRSQAKKASHKLACMKKDNLVMTTLLCYNWVN